MPTESRRAERVRAGEASASGQWQGLRRGGLALAVMLVGAAAATLHHEYLVRPLAPTFAREVWVVCGEWVLLTLVALLVARGVIRPRLHALAARQRAAWLVASLVAGGLLILVIPLAAVEPPAALQLKITATGRKNPQAKGTEVWLLSARAGGRPIPLGDFVQAGTWTPREQRLLSITEQPATLSWSGVPAGPVELEFVTHGWSGIVEIDRNGRAAETDLFSTENTRRTLRFPNLAENVWWAVPWAVWARVAQGLTLAFVVLTAGLLLGRTKLELCPTRSPGRWAAWQYGGFCALVWSVYLVAYWPGCMTGDSIEQWRQSQTLQLRNDHPFTHTLMIALVNRIWPSPAAVALAQILGLAAVVGWGVASLRRAGVPRWAAVAVTGLIALSPANSVLAVTLWKDVSYGIALLALSVILLNVVRTDGAALERAGFWLGLAGSAAALALLRHNGLVAAVGTPLLLLLVYRRQWRPLLASGAVILLLCVGLRPALSRGLHVRPSRLTPEMVLFYQIAAHQAYGTPLTPDERALIAAVHRPGEQLAYDPYTARPIFRGGLDWDLVNAHRSEVRQAFWDTLRRAPLVNLRHVLSASSFVWRIGRPPGSFYDTSPVWREGSRLRYVTTNNIGLAEQTPAPGLADWLMRVGQRNSNRLLSTLWWRPALWLYLGVAAAIIGAVRCGRPALLVVLCPLLLHSAFTAAFPITNNFRYQFGVYITGMLLTGLFAIRRQVAATGEGGSVGR